MSLEQQARDAADEFRSEHGLGTQPIPDLITMVERTIGVDVTVLHVATTGAHGLTVQYRGTVIIGVACTNKPLRQRTNIAHELGHLIFDSVDRDAGTKLWSQRDPNETLADAFARHLLVPLDAIGARVADAAIDRALLSDLVQDFLVSPHMVAIQLREAGVIDAATCDAWAKATAPSLATEFGWRTMYDSLAAESQRPRPPQRLLARATRGYAQGAVTLGLLATLNGSNDLRGTKERLDAAGIALPGGNRPARRAIRPTTNNEGFTASDLAALLGDDE